MWRCSVKKIAQSITVYVVHHTVLAMIRSHIRIEDRHDIRMAKAGDEFDLAFEALASRNRCIGALVKDFNPQIS